MSEEPVWQVALVGTFHTGRRAYGPWLENERAAKAWVEMRGGLGVEIRTITWSREEEHRAPTWVVVRGTLAHGCSVYGFTSEEDAREFIESDFDPATVLEALPIRPADVEAPVCPVGAEIAHDVHGRLQVDRAVYGALIEDLREAAALLRRSTVGGASADAARTLVQDVLLRMKAVG
jgi:hypothetical protein